MPTKKHASDFESLPLFQTSNNGIPKKLITSSDLKPINNLKTVFHEIRNYFAGNVTGITRDETIAQNIMRLLFCKLYDEKNNQGLVDFANRPDEDLVIFQNRIQSLFEKVKSVYPDIFDKDEKIEISPMDLSFIISKLENYSINNADRDVIGDAFEELIGTSLRGGEGQFFTPRNVVQMMIDVLSPREGERIIDPACGSGGFLAYTVKYLKTNNINDYYLAGIDKDAFLSKIAKIYLSLLGNEEYHIYCENSLEVPSKWKHETQQNIGLNSFDVVLTNPPFGAKIPVVGKELLKQYRLGHKWEKHTSWTETKTILNSQPPQILFIERCLQLLKEGGRLGIVLPEGLFGNPTDRYIWEYISSVASIIGIVSLSQETFQPSTHTKTSVLFLRKKAEKPKSIFMAIANNVGHNKNGKPVYKLNVENGIKEIDDDLPIIGNKFSEFINHDSLKDDHLGFSVSYQEINDHIFIPEYYNPEIKREINSLQISNKFNLISIGE